MLRFVQISNRAANFVIVANKTGKAENYRNTKSQYPRDLMQNNCNSKIFPIVTPIEREKSAQKRV